MVEESGTLESQLEATKVSLFLDNPMLVLMLKNKPNHNLISQQKYVHLVDGQSFLNSVNTRRSEPCAAS